MKKVLLILFSVALLLSMAGVATASAEETTPGSASGSLTLSKVVTSEDVTVYYSAEETYTVIIPEFVRFGPVEAQKSVTTTLT